MTNHGECATSPSQTDRPVLPQVINLQAIDVCNSRCVMCEVWKSGRREVLGLSELHGFLAQPYFAEVVHVGVTGGEPTLRKDLVQLYHMLPGALPRMRGASFITHGLQTKRAVEVYGSVHRDYAARGLTLDGMVSIDGVGALHDAVRGRQGAFIAATETLMALRAAAVPTIAACTIVRRNVYGLHELLDWAKEHQIYVRFRVGEFINRLYNESCREEIRNFDDAQLRHLVSFFHLLLGTYETAAEVQKTYRSILALLTGDERLVGCPYRRGNAINVDCLGSVAACAPKDRPVRLPASVEDAHALLEARRADIGRRFCSGCIHDYHDDWLPEVANRLAEDRRRAEALYAAPDASLTAPEALASDVDFSAMRQVVLVGWYGTETAGDIAILRGILSEYLALNADLRFHLLSLHPYYTRANIAAWPLELQNRITVSDYASAAAAAAVSDCDAVVMAGGPLMDIPETGLVLRLFKHFADQGKPRVIEGCGVGPLNQADCRWNVCRLARLASRISVRDGASRDLLRALGITKHIEVRRDPASAFIRALGVQHRGQGSGIIRCFLRELTAEYPQELGSEAVRQNLVQLLRNLLDWYPNHRVELWAMHYFSVGNDDRLFARELARAVGSPRLVVDWQPRTPEEIAGAMAEAEFCVCMRFHSCVFAADVGVPFVAIDYTAGGKIRAFLEESGQAHRLTSPAELGTLTQLGLAAKIGSAVPRPAPRDRTASGDVVVLHVLECLGGGGAARAAIAMATELGHLGSFEHRIVSLRPAERDGRRLAAAAAFEVLDVPGTTELLHALAAADIVLVHWWNSPEIAQLFSRELPPMRLALWLHVGGYHAPHVISPALLEYADLTVACSPHTYAHPAFSTVDASRKAMVLAGADFSRLSGFARRAHTGFRVGYIGTVDPVKMHPDYVALSCGVRVEDARFVVCGHGDTGWLERAAEQAGQRARFEFRGPVEDIRSVLEELDVYGYPLAPDTYAAAELNLQEAMFAGLPVVAFPYGGIGRLIRNGETGVLVTSPEEYARAIERLHADPAERERLGRNAAAFARENWGAKNAARGFGEQISRLLKGPKTMRPNCSVLGVPAGITLGRDAAINPGARTFVAMLGEAGTAYSISMNAEDVTMLLSAEEEIGRMPRIMQQSCGGYFRHVFPRDAFLNLWSGLVALRMGNGAAAGAAFGAAQRNGLQHWRVLWYAARAAESCNQWREAKKALDEVLRVVPEFGPALEMKRRLEERGVTDPRAAASVAMQYVQQSQQCVREGKLAEARDLLARAVEILPAPQLTILELIADLDCRRGDMPAAERVLDLIMRAEPNRTTPRLVSIRATVKQWSAARPSTTARK
ncbi:polysaccharide pyruvyl transferase family protein [Opitutus sp. ER46]|uniref:polysaccharide pyruvyl transferase family protein n=1 Tax=Opitutus sp. ER46 TaxID=2161864 RepID=UPI000D2F5D14|nr:polysaccharide pyruvyl transferase family protein [Opitutus sp. ER46]PTX90873.1 hypothetical protein DB354_19675 [Opitutus sp. ER46]